MKVQSRRLKTNIFAFKPSKKEGKQLNALENEAEQKATFSSKIILTVPLVDTFLYADWLIDVKVYLRFPYSCYT